MNNNLGSSINGLVDNAKKEIEYFPHKDKLSGDDEFRYQMLGRLKGDLDYYKGSSGFMGEDNLWGGTLKDHLADLRGLYKSFPQDKRPEWLTEEQVSDYEKLLKPENAIFNPDDFGHQHIYSSVIKPNRAYYEETYGKHPQFANFLKTADEYYKTK